MNNILPNGTVVQFIISDQYRIDIERTGKIIGTTVKNNEMMYEVRHTAGDFEGMITWIYPREITLVVDEKKVATLTCTCKVCKRDTDVGVKCYWCEYIN